MARFALVFGSALLVAACSGGTPSSTATAVAATTAVTASPSAAPTSPSTTSAPTASIRPTPTPVVGMGLCPTDSLLTVSQFMEADPACFGGAAIEILGWLDGPPGVGFEPPFVEPGWLDRPAPGLPALWTAKPTEPDHNCPPEPLPCGWFFLHLDPASGLNLDIKPREIIVKGHLDDPAAETCHFVYPDDWSEPPMDDALAVAGCRTKFVVESFEDAP